MKPTQQDIDNEIWLPIPGYEGIYEASSLGRIKSLQRVLKLTFGSRPVPDKIKKQGKHKDGYSLIRLHSNGVGVSFAVSRIIGKLFVPNPENLPEINHIDLDKANNFYKNLEWTDRNGNMQHAFANRKIKRGYETKNTRYKMSLGKTQTPDREQK